MIWKLKLNILSPIKILQIGPNQNCDLIVQAYGFLNPILTLD